jgi:two-component system chemotaxis response regulator CheB
MPERLPLRAMVLGASTGGVAALKGLLGALPEVFPVPILIVLHISPEAEGTLAALMNEWTPLRVKEADADELPQPGTAYLAPANYHLQVEPDGRLSLSTDPPVHFARPSVDVLFETAAAAHGPALAGILLTGGGSDGCLGLKCIQKGGGITIVQDPRDAECDAMPLAALRQVTPDYLISLAELPGLMIRLTCPYPQ